MVRLAPRDGQNLREITDLPDANAFVTPNTVKEGALALLVVYQ